MSTDRISRPAQEHIPPRTQVAGRLEGERPGAHPLPARETDPDDVGHSGIVRHDRRVPAPAHPTRGADHAPWSRSSWQARRARDRERGAARQRARRSERPSAVVHPARLRRRARRRYPCVDAYRGLAGQLDMWRNREPFRRNYPEMVDGLFTGAACDAVAFVDCWTSLGGARDSTGKGRDQDFLAMRWYLRRTSGDRRSPIRTPRDPGPVERRRRPLVTPMLRGDVSALTSHAGDALFEACYLPEFREAVRALRDQLRGFVRPLLGGLPVAPRVLEEGRRRAARRVVHGGVLLVGRRRHCPAALRGVDRPAMVDDVWRRWLDKDPVRMIPRHADELRSMPGDLGRRRYQGRVVPGQRRRRGLEGVEAPRRRAHARTVRRRSHGDLVPVSQVAGVPVGRPLPHGLELPIWEDGRAARRERFPHEQSRRHPRPCPLLLPSPTDRRQLLGVAEPARSPSRSASSWRS